MKNLMAYAVGSCIGVGGGVLIDQVLAAHGFPPVERTAVVMGIALIAIGAMLISKWW